MTMTGGARGSEAHVDWNAAGASRRPVRDIPTRVARELFFRHGRPFVVVHPGVVTLRGNGLSNTGRAVRTTPLRDGTRRFATLGGNASMVGVQQAPPVVRSKITTEMRAVQLLQR